MANGYATYLGAIVPNGITVEAMSLSNGHYIYGPDKMADPLGSVYPTKSSTEWTAFGGFSDTKKDLGSFRNVQAAVSAVIRHAKEHKAL